MGASEGAKSRLRRSVDLRRHRPRFAAWKPGKFDAGTGNWCFRCPSRGGEPDKQPLGPTRGRLNPREPPAKRTPAAYDELSSIIAAECEGPRLPLALRRW